MKLLTLTIHNIASIADATINFDQGPLARENIFLIAGATGAGKSTIIDCICLCLYGTTPRYKSAAKDSFEVLRADGQDDVDGLSTDDEKQLLRRGTGEGFTELSFSDDKGTKYTARWAVKRARNKITGKLQNVEWTLTSPKESLRKVREIKERITSIIGLEADQFMRTVVLPQGAFAQFLQSKEDDKSALLEKITGTSIYSEIGKKIFELKGKEVERLNYLKAQVSGITLLSDEEKEAKKAEIAALQEQINTEKAATDKLTAKITWLDALKAREEAVTKQQSDLEAVNNEIDSDQYRNRATFLTQRDANTDALDRLARLNEYRSNLASARDTQKKLQNTCDTLCGGLRHLDDRIVKGGNRIKQLQTTLEQMAALAPLEPNVGTIAVHIDSILQAQRDLAGAQDALVKDKKKLDGYKKEEQKIKNKLDEELKKLEELKGKRDDIANQLKNKNIAEITAQRDALDEARDALKAWKDDLDALKAKEKDLDAATKREATLSKDLAAATKARELAETARNAKQEAYDLFKPSMEDVAQRFRRDFKPGCTCPVCRQTVDHIVDETTIQSEFDGLKALLDTATAAFNTAQNAENKAQREHDRAQGTLETLRNTIAQDRKHCSDTQADATRLCKAVGINALDPGDIERHSTSINQQIAALDQQIKEINALQNEQTKLNTSIGKQEKDIDKTRKSQEANEVDLDNCRSSITAQETLIKTSTQRVADDSTQLDALVPAEQWRPHLDALAAYKTQLIKQIKDYTKTKTDLETSQDELSNLKEQRSRIDDDRNAVATLLTVDLDAATSREVANLENKWSELARDAHSCQDSINAATASITSTDAAVNAALAGITRERLEEIAQQPAAIINQWRSTQQALNDKLHQTQALLENAVKARDEHQQASPLAEGDTLETINAALAAGTERFNSLLQQQGALNEALKQDAERAAGLADKQKEIDLQQAIADKWTHFAEILGSADGKKFRSIAQSLILSDLLHRANDYLRRLNSHHRLECATGKLVVLVRDLDMGGQALAATSLSGGETFMASLALALALAQFSTTVMPVDTLFIDEGFGSLSGDYLVSVIETLSTLHSFSGRRVGIISHVETLKERIPTKILVTRDPNDNTRSTISIDPPEI